MSALRTVTRIELTRMLRDPATWAIVITFALLAAFAAHTGAGWATSRAQIVAAAVAEADETMALRRQAFVEKVAAGEKPAFGLIYATALPYRAGLPNAPLAALSAGQAESYPAAAAVHPFVDPATIFERFSTGLESPAVLNAGRFDLAFVLVYLLPLLLLAGTYDLWARDRESGAARLQLAQPIRPAVLLGLRTAVRSGVLLIPMTGVAVLALLLVAPAAAPAGFAAVALVTFIYGLFWVAVAFVINLFVRTSTTAALACGTVWLALVMLIPAVAAAAVDLAEPAPSAARLANALRAETVAVRARTRAAAAVAGPTMPASGAERVYPETLWTARREIAPRETRTGPIFASYADRQATHRRLGEAARFLSPAVLAQDAFDHIAGTDAARALAFQDQAKAFVGVTRALAFDWMDRDRILTLADYDGGLPRFAFIEKSGRGVLFADLVALAALVALVATLGAVGLRRRALIQS